MTDIMNEKRKIYKRIWNRVFSLFLVIFLLFSSVEPIAAAETFITSNEPGQAISMTLEGTTVVFNSFPEEKDYKYVWIETGEDFVDDSIYAISGPVRYSLPSQDGTYYLQIAKGKERYGQFRGVIYGKTLAVKIENGVADFVDSPVLENNETRYQKNSKSKTALGYYLQPSLWVESDSKEIKEAAKKIVNPDDSDYVKVQKVHDWVANNIWYDYDDYYERVEGEVSALEVLHSKKSVCQGYADLTAALLRSLGIPTKVVSGYSLGLSTSGEWTKEIIEEKESNHAWNEAYVDGRWIIMDTTWDSDNKYENGTFSTGTGLDGRTYFDPTLEMFALDHRIMENDEYAVEKKDIINDGLSISKRSLVLKKGATKQLQIKNKTSYINLKDAKITYTSSKPSVAYVSKTGKIRAKKTGTSNITTKVKLDGVTVKFTTKVIVK